MEDITSCCNLTQHEWDNNMNIFTIQIREVYAKTHKTDRDKQSIKHDEIII